MLKVFGRIPFSIIATLCIQGSTCLVELPVGPSQVDAAAVDAGVGAAEAFVDVVPAVGPLEPRLAVTLVPGRVGETAAVVARVSGAVVPLVTVRS